MIFKLLLLCFVLYLAFKLVFNVIVPVVRTTQRVRKGFREMQERMNAQSPGQQAAQPQSRHFNDPDQSKDYIEFEEVK